MASSTTSASADPGAATLTVERLDVRDGELLVQGRWTGVRGMRFLRPTLVATDRQVLATLEHKPWAPRDGERWTAAFPWADGTDGLDDAWLEVAPSVMVPLGRHAAAGTPPAAVPAAAPVVPAVPAASAAPATVLSSPAPAPAPAVDPAPVPSRPVAGDAELREAERRAEDAERAARAAEADRDRARAMVDEAVRDREAATRTRDRLSDARDEAVAAQAEAERRRDAGIAEARRQRDEAVAEARHERDEARRALQQARDEHAEVRGQRDEVLAAHRALEQALRAERAQRAGGDEPTPGPAAASVPAVRPTPVAMPAADRDDEAPIGIRAIPAAHAAGATTRRATHRQADLQPFDRWALRVLATTAATCFILLLLLLVRVFV